MEKKAYAFAAGLFTLLLGAGVVVAAMWLSGDTDARVSYVLESRHPVSGLNIQAPVRLRGVEVGKVESIAFDPANARLILVRVGVRAGTPITRATTAQLGSQGVTGLAYVMLEDDGSKPEPLPPVASGGDARIPVRASFMDELSGSGKDLLSEVSQVAQRLNKLLDDKNQAQLVRTLTSLETVATRAVALARTLEPATANLPALTADARTAITRADAMFVELTGLARELRQQAGVLERVAKSAEQVGGSTQTVSSAVALEALPRISVLLEEMTRSSRSLDRLLTELNEQPASLVFGRGLPPPGPGEPGFIPQRGSKP